MNHSGKIVDSANQPFLPNIISQAANNSCKASTASRSDVRTGESGELLAVSKLLKMGYNAYSVSAGHTYDIVVENESRQLLRVQVKTSSVAKSRYSFTVQRGFHYSPKGCFAYSSEDYDISACVNLFDEKVLFTAGVHRALNWSRRQFLQDNAERMSWEAACSALTRGAAQ